MSSKNRKHSKPSIGNLALGVLVILINPFTLAHTISFAMRAT